MRRLTIMSTMAIATLVLAPDFAIAQGGPMGADRASPDASGHRAGQGANDQGRGKPAGGDQRMRQGAGDRGDDRQDRRRGDNDRPRGNQDGMRSDNDRQDRMRGDNDRRGDNSNRADRARGDNDRERVRGDNDRRPPGRDRTVRITTEQRTQIRSRFRGLGGERIRGADFAVNVGRPVPTRYRFSRLPPEIVDIVPEYRDFDYIQVGDQILIVDPGTRQIVYVLD